MRGRINRGGPRAVPAAKERREEHARYRAACSGPYHLTKALRNTVDREFQIAIRIGRSRGHRIRRKHDVYRVP